MAEGGKTVLNMGGVAVNLDPTQLTKAAYTAAKELQKAVEATERNKDQCQLILEAMRHTAPLYADLLQLCDAGMVDEKFDVQFRETLRYAVDKLERGRDEVYRFIMLNKARQYVKAPELKETLEHVHEGVKEARSTLHVYMTEAGLHLQLQNMAEVQQLNAAAAAVVEQLKHIGEMNVRSGDKEVVKGVARLSVGEQKERACAVKQLVAWARKGRGRELAEAGVVSALWRNMQPHGSGQPDRAPLWRCYELLSLLAADSANVDAFLRCGGQEAQKMLDRMTAWAGEWTCGSSMRPGGHTTVCFSPFDPNLLASASNPVRLWDINTGGCRHALDGHTGTVGSVSFSPSAPNVLASGSDDRTVRLWDVSNGQCLRTLEGHTKQVTSVCFSPSGHLASGSEDGTLRLWDTDTGRCLQMLRGLSGEFYSVCFSPTDPNLLACTSCDNTVRLWDISTGRWLQLLEGHTRWVSSVCFSPIDRSIVASASDDETVRLWEVSSGRCLHTLGGHTGRVMSVSFSPAVPDLLASASDDRTVRLWDSSCGRCLHTLEHGARVHSVAFSPLDPCLLASATKDDNKVHLWRAATR